MKIWMMCIQKRLNGKKLKKWIIFFFVAMQFFMKNIQVCISIEILFTIIMLHLICNSRSIFFVKWNCSSELFIISSRKYNMLHVDFDISRVCSYDLIHGIFIIFKWIFMNILIAIQKYYFYILDLLYILNHYIIKII